jgi:hypothetical protein
MPPACKYFCTSKAPFVASTFVPVKHLLWLANAAGVMREYAIETA